MEHEFYDVGAKMLHQENAMLIAKKPPCYRCPFTACRE